MIGVTLASMRARASSSPSEPHAPFASIPSPFTYPLQGSIPLALDVVFVELKSHAIALPQFCPAAYVDIKSSFFLLRRRRQGNLGDDWDALSLQWAETYIFSLSLSQISLG